MGNAGQDPTYRQVEQKIIEPLLDFRHQVQPLNQIHNDCIQQFTTMMMGLLTGSDGETAMQGPGSNALAELIGNFLDGEQQLSGTDPSTLEGRLQDAAVICERHAHNLQTTINSFPTSRNNGNPSIFANIMGILDDGDGPEDEGPDDPDDVAIGELMQYQGDMQVPTNEPLPATPDINALPANTSPNPALGDNAGFIQSLGIDPIDISDGNGNGDPAAIVPSQAVQAADYAEENNGDAQPGYVGDRPYANDGRGGGEVLPQTTPDGQPITYKEYDINPRTPGVNRGAQRVVIGSDGSRWYTNDHYRTFTGF